MEAKPVDALPEGPQWQYEPKWDGFRCLAFRDGAEVYLQSKSGQPLARYFPDIVATLAALKPKRFVLDGEIVIPIQGRLSFDELLLRIHPAASRVKKLAEAHPATFVVFDLLANERGRSLTSLPLAERRPKLEQFASAYLPKSSQIRLSPATTRRTTADRWFKTVGGNLDGLIAKRLDLPYRSGERDGMQKIKKRRTAECVVGGFRYAEEKEVEAADNEKSAARSRKRARPKPIGSLLLGLYDKDGLLHHVGFTSSFTNADRPKLTTLVEPLIEPPGFTGRAPGGPSRWSTRRTDEWKPLRPQLVVEVEYDHFTNGRFRHGTKFLRWRSDKLPRQCTLDQIERSGAETLKLLQ